VDKKKLWKSSCKNNFYILSFSSHTCDDYVGILNIRFFSHPYHKQQQKRKIHNKKRKTQQPWLAKIDDHDKIYIKKLLFFTV
jgi:hypothetical protein